METFFVNAEQSPKTRGTSPTQESISRAFANNQRQSNYVLSFKKQSFVLLSGMNTGQLGVSRFEAPDGSVVEATDPERTLIDLVVRPAYAGGVSAVLEAYKSARTRLDFQKMLDYLQQLAYIYPYHQAIGFYADRAGYRQDQVEMLKRLGLHFDFYLAHGMKNPVLDPNWRIFRPKMLAP